ncbi:MAG: hypothetical protein ACKO9H_06845 [Planctomycetota bacterium]
MWKSFFLAVGIFLLILGVESLVVDKFIMANGKAIPRLMNGNATPVQQGPFTPASYGRMKREMTTKDWMPWSLLASGVITVMYTLSLHNRSAGGDE